MAQSQHTRTDIDLHGEGVQLLLQKIFILEMFVCYRDEDLKLARDEGPAEDDVEPGPAVLQEVGDGPLVPSGATGAVGQQGDVSVRYQSLI